MMLFNIQMFLAEQEENPETKEELLKYYQFVQPKEEIHDISDLKFYKDYVSLFKTRSVKVPEETEKDFDWDLLMQLCAASLSNDVYFELSGTDELPALIISVTHEDTQVKKKLDELWGFQILRLYEIYLTELINFEVVIAEDEQEASSIEMQRKKKLDMWTYNFIKLDAELLNRKWGV